MVDVAAHPLSTRDRAVVGALLVIPLLALLIVPLYARRGPELLGFPFFYWYQLLWVFLASGCTQLAYMTLTRARRSAGGRR